MAEITGVFAATHTPVMLNFPEAVTAGELEAVHASFKELGRRIAAARPQAIVIASDRKSVV